jgi:branched-chain amino acid transport system substrate-binding protein
MDSQESSAGGPASRSSGEGTTTGGPPADVRTFLIADVRGYTRFTQEHGDEEAAELAATFAFLAGKVVTAGGGQVLELRGDEALAVFGSARQALRAAVELQRQFRERTDGQPVFPLGIGIGLDSGEAVPIAGGYRGGALNVASRLCSLAAPGQILATETVVSLARRLDGIRFVQRRAVRLKGLDQPVRTIEVLPEAPLPPVPEPVRPGLVARARTRPRALVLLAVGVALLLASTAAVVVRLTAGSGSRPLGNAVAALDSAGRVVSLTEVGTTPSNVVVGEGAIWVLNADDQTVSRIDPETRQITKTFGTGGTTTDLAVGEGALWIGNSEAVAGRDINYTATVSRIDPQSSVVMRKVRLPRPKQGDPPFGVFPGVSQLAVGRGSVWAINPDHTVSRIDAATGDVVATVPVRAGSSVAAGREGVWVVDDGRAVTRINPRTNQPGQTIEVGASFLLDLALGAGSVWVTAPEEGVVWRIEPGPERITRTISVGRGVTTISFANGALWAANFVDGTVSRIDPRTNSVTRTTAIFGTPQGIEAATEGTVWVSVVGETTSGSLPSAACGRIEAGDKSPDVLIASDFPLQGAFASTSRPMTDAIRFVLREHEFTAGEFAVGYQSCDDSTAQTGSFEFLKCSSNAKAYAGAEQLVGLIGTLNSGCASVQIPIVNRASGGPLAMISPANTYVGLTRAGPGAPQGDPEAFYPTGVRNYFRVIAYDTLQGTAHALLAKRLGLTSVYVLNGDDDYGAPLAQEFTTASRRLGVEIAGSGSWDPRAGSYAHLADRVARSRADGVFLGGFLFLNGGEVAKALRARLGRKVVLMASDGFSPVPDLLEILGRDALGMYVSSTWAAPGPLGRAGQRFVREFASTQAGPSIQPFVLESAQAAETLLEAIARSDGTRSSVLRKLRALTVRDGILGSFRFDGNGDKAPGTITIYRITGKTPPGAKLGSDLQGAVVDRVVSVPSRLLP